MPQDLLKDFIWHRAIKVEGEDENIIRQDYAGALIRWDEFEQNTEYGWTMTPMLPITKGGKADFMSMIPWHIQNAKSKGDNYTHFETVLTSDANQNITKVQKWENLKKIC